MSYLSKIVNPLDYADWNNLVISSPGYTIFHTSNWARVLHESYGFKPVYSAFMENGRLAALIPCMEVRSLLTGRRGVSLPFTDYCEPLIRGDNGFLPAMDRLMEYGKSEKWDYIEFRGERYFPQEVSCSEFYLGHVLTLQGDDETIFSGFRDSTKRNIKKAAKMGVQVEISVKMESLAEFCRLNCLTRKFHGVPPQPYHFFENIYKHILLNNLGMVVLASYGKQYVAGAVFFHFGNQAFYKYGASDRSHQELRANNLVMWEAIRWYLGKGFKALSFGRTEQDATGLKQFKMGWGANEEKIKYFKYDLEKERVTGDGSAVKERRYSIFHALPTSLSKIAGQLLYRHIG